MEYGVWTNASNASSIIFLVQLGHSKLEPMASTHELLLTYNPINFRVDACAEYIFIVAHSLNVFVHLSHLPW